MLECITAVRPRCPRNTTLVGTLVRAAASISLSVSRVEDRCKAWASAGSNCSSDTAPDFTSAATNDSPAARGARNNSSICFSVSSFVRANNCRTSAGMGSTPAIAVTCPRIKDPPTRVKITARR